ncbi:LysR family transcriptional regulator [Bosea sp. (in: a-proteobacteria)]|uniref:LysR family transcriptional regulator n=1 Tax=Bosea sp. (in: a-proteobacteria) TaxID=1871050 RepID=UPI003F71E9A5
MTFAQLKSFYLAATLGTFALAAKRLNATQPAISSRIAALEQQLGTKLFDRTGHRVALTPEGRSFLRFAEKLLEVQAQALLSFGKGKLTGTIRIGAADTMAITWFPDFLAELKRLHPEASIELHIGPSFRLREELSRRQLDVGFIVGPSSAPELISRMICECPMVFAAAPKLGLHGRLLSGADLELLEIFTFERMTQPHQDLSRKMRQADIRLRLAPISSLQTIILLTVKGLGIGAVPLCVVEQEVAEGRLVLLESEFEFDSLYFSATYPDGPDVYVGQTIAQLAFDFLKSRPASEGIKILY